MKVKSFILTALASFLFISCSDDASSPYIQQPFSSDSSELISSNSNNSNDTQQPVSSNSFDYLSSESNVNQEPASSFSTDPGSSETGSMAPTGTPVNRIGALSVNGNKIVGANGQPPQLRGMSMFWNIYNEGTKYYNSSVVDWLASDWNVSVVRAAIALEQDGDINAYASDPNKGRAMAETIIDAAIKNGIYVIIDCHSHWMDDNQMKNGKNRWDWAVDFFTYMATKYGSYPNVIYEIFNEPGTEDWSRIKPYAEYIIPKIRAIDPDNLIIVGTPGYSSKVDLVTPLTGVTNVAYTFHFYASETWHHDNYLPMVKNVAKQLPLFVTEWGLSPASGNGYINMSYVNDFMTWMEGEQLSWAAWSICDKNESSAALIPGASVNGNWSESNLSESGRYLRNKILELNK